MSAHPTTATGTGAAHNAAAGRYLFTPPTQNVVPQIAFEMPPLGNRLMRFFRTRPEGRAIWVLPGLIYTFNQPWPTIGPEVGQIGDLDPVVAGGVATMVSNKIAVTYLYVYLGGHEYVVDAAERLRLSDFLSLEGYDPDDWFTPVEEPVVPPTHPTGVTWNQPGITWNQPGLNWNGG